MNGSQAPATVTEFRDRLFQLHQRCGRPSYTVMRQAAEAHATVRLAKATLSEFLADKHPNRLPRQDFVTAFVVGCRYPDQPDPAELAAELRQWDQWWSALVVATGAPPTASAPRSAEVASRPWYRRHQTVSVGIVSGLAGCLLGSWVVPPLAGPGSDPSIRFGPCGERIAATVRVGHVALLTQTGPPGLASQDRLVELRVQRHPGRGWIAWAQLARSTSDLDRLWLDWSYFKAPTDQELWRVCGSQSVTVGAGTPALLVNDAEGRPRWFRACAQVPAADRAPDRTGTFCTSWRHPLP